MNEQINEAEARSLIKEWFLKLNEHAPVKDVRRLLAVDTALQKWPEMTCTDQRGFQDWYEPASCSYFDEVHTPKDPLILINADGSADVKLVVSWTAKALRRGSASMQILTTEACQTWKVVRSQRTGDAVIKRITIDPSSRGGDWAALGAAEPSEESELKAYDQLCTSYHAIDAFRSKLLGFLPLASGGIFILLNDKLFKAVEAKGAVSTSDTLDDWSNTPLLVVGIFGLVVTLGLAVFEAYGIRRCTALIAGGQDLEASLGMDEATGQFRRRPPDFFNEPLASGVVYGAVAAAWAYVGLRGLFRQHGWIHIAVPCVFLVAGMAWMKWTQCASVKAERGRGRRVTRLAELPRS